MNVSSGHPVTLNHDFQFLWWAGKDSNLGSRWQQIYSLPPLSTRVPARKSTSCAVAVLPSHSRPLLKLAGRMDKPASRFVPYHGHAPRILHGSTPASHGVITSAPPAKENPPLPTPPISATTQPAGQGRTVGKLSENMIPRARLTCDFRSGGRSHNACNVCVMCKCLECTDRPERHRAEESESRNASANT